MTDSIQTVESVRLVKRSDPLKQMMVVAESARITVVKNLHKEFLPFKAGQRFDFDAVSRWCSTNGWRIA